MNAPDAQEADANLAAVAMAVALNKLLEWISKEASCGDFEYHIDEEAMSAGRKALAQWAEAAQEHAG